MANEEMYDDEFIIYLSIEGTEFEEVEVKVEDPYKSIREAIDSIVSVFELPKMDNGGMPIQYMLGTINSERGEKEIFPFADKNGQECALIEHVHSGQKLDLVRNIIPG
jgi:hypothetical protein